MRTSALTSSGILVDLMQPRPELIRIEDIARALSRQCRFNGHSNGFYSVAEHSWLVSHVAEQLAPCDPLQALLHDASEAYLGDVITPLKRTMPEYLALEEKWMAVIAEALGFQHPLVDTTEEADHILVMREGMVLMNGWASMCSEADLRLAQEWHDLPINCLGPVQAYNVFMQRFHELKRRLAA